MTKTTNSLKKHYSLTVHFDNKKNPADAVPDFSTMAIMKDSTCTFQLEVGENTKKYHWQVCISFKNKTYGTTIKNEWEDKSIGLVQFEEAKNINALKNYVIKTNTQIGNPYCWVNGRYLKTGYHSIQNRNVYFECGPPRYTTKYDIPQVTDIRQHLTCIRRKNQDDVYEIDKATLRKILMENLRLCQNYLKGITDTVKWEQITGIPPQN